jgi:hypothetical protein
LDNCKKYPKVLEKNQGSISCIVVKDYNDASFQIDADDSKSQSGFMFCLNRGAVSWKNSKYDIVADSTTEVEYIAASEAAKEVVWIRFCL